MGTSSLAVEPCATRPLERPKGSVEVGTRLPRRAPLIDAFSLISGPVRAILGYAAHRPARVAYEGVENTSRADNPELTLRDRLLHLIRESDSDKVWSSAAVVEAISSGLLPQMTRMEICTRLCQLHDKQLIDRVGWGKYRLNPIAAYPVSKRRPAATYDPSCESLAGDMTYFQWRAKEHLNISDVHLWMVWNCVTPRCLTHAAAAQPRALGYQHGICVYCGLDADTRDHLMPQTWTGKAVRASVLTVPACRECNSAIADHYAYEVDTRRHVAHAHIANKYRKHLVAAEAHKADIKEYGVNLRNFIQTSIDISEVTRLRLAWPPSPEYDIDAALAAGIEDPYAFGLLSGVFKAVA